MSALDSFEVAEKEKRIEALYRPNLKALLRELKALLEAKRVLDSTNIFGASPPAVFIGQWGYPQVMAGPLVPSVNEPDTAIMDDPRAWLDHSLKEIIRYRLSLIRGKAPLTVGDASHPSKLLQAIQESSMSSSPVDTEVWLKKKPSASIQVSVRDAPSGPSAPMLKVELAEDPTIPRAVDRVASDSHLGAGEAIVYLHDHGITHQQIIRLLSVGLLGVEGRRRLVPTEWSITAVDDIIGKALRKKVLECRELDDYLIFGHSALANNVQILLMPSAWMFEALEAWLISPSSLPEGDYELAKGRTTYPTKILGAYHATRLPVLEALNRMKRQAGAIVFMEVSREWVPLGVWRFREISRAALAREPIRATSLEESLNLLERRLKVPMKNWVQASRLIEIHKHQRPLRSYF